jgi:hypothetical protein
MNRQQLESKIQSIGSPFWLVLTSGEQLCCQAVLSLDNAAITVVVGGGYERRNGFV